jgi:hypothetical protein
MVIRFSCAHCDKRLAVSDDRAGRTAKCPQCQASLTIPELDRTPALLLPGEQSVYDPFTDFKAIEEAAAASSETASVAKPIFSKLATTLLVEQVDWIMLIRIMVRVVVCFTFLATLNSPPSLWILVHYATLVAILWHISQWTFGRFNISLTVAKWGGALFVAAVTSYYFTTWDVYEVRWESDEGTRYTDRYQRYQGGPFYRFVVMDGIYHFGPMKGEGKRHPHGMWTALGGGVQEETFYWYGETVSEGEWHLRNR